MFEVDACHRDLLVEIRKKQEKTKQNKTKKQKTTKHRLKTTNQRLQLNKSKKTGVEESFPETQWLTFWTATS